MSLTGQGLKECRPTGELAHLPSSPPGCFLTNLLPGLQPLLQLHMQREVQSSCLEKPTGALLPAWTGTEWLFEIKLLITAVLLGVSRAGRELGEALSSAGLAGGPGTPAETAAQGIVLQLKHTPASAGQPGRDPRPIPGASGSAGWGAQESAFLASFWVLCCWWVGPPLGSVA